MCSQLNPFGSLSLYTAGADGSSDSSAQHRGLESRLLEERDILIFGEINSKMAHYVTARLLLMAKNSAKPIHIFINSPGGHVESGDTIYDVIRYISRKTPVLMNGTGWVASAAALIFLAAEPKRRVCFPNTRFLLHQPMGGVQGPAVDIDIEAREIIKTRERLNRIIAEATGQNYEKVARDTDRNYWMNAEEAVDYGLVHKIVTTSEER